MVSVEEGLKIADELFEILAATETGIGLAANQVGIDARVAVVNVIEPRILINPLVVEYSNPFMHSEACLSFPGKSVMVQRYKLAHIQVAQEEAGWLFQGQSGDDLLECVCIQHEIDHLNGKTIIDHVTAPLTAAPKIGRNDPCHCGSGKKFKKCHAQK